MTRLLVLTCLSSLALVACKDDLPTARNDTVVPAADQDCAIALITPLIGERPEVLDQIVIPEPFRVIEPGMMVTQDYRPDRTNIVVDAHGYISRVWCG